MTLSLLDYDEVRRQGKAVLTDGHEPANPDRKHILLLRFLPGPVLQDDMETVA